MRLALAGLCVGLLAACSDDGTTSAAPDAQSPTSGQGGTAGMTGGAAGTIGGAGGMVSPPDGGRSGEPPEASGHGGGVIIGSPDAGPGGGSPVSTHLIAHGTDGCVITRDGTPQCWDTFGSPASSPFPETFVAVYGGPVDRNGWLCLRDSAGGYSCDGGGGRPPSEHRVTDIAIGNAFTSCGLRSDQTIVCWDVSVGTATPSPIAPSGPFAQIAAGPDVFCGLRADGTGECWGDSASEYAFPADARFVQFSLGMRLACGVTAAGAVVCWGPNIAEIRVPPPTSGVRSVHVGASAGCALMEDGRAACFGSEIDPSLDPPEHRFRELAPGYRSSCGISTDDLVWCWERGLSKQMFDQTGQPLLARDP